MKPLEQHQVEIQRNKSSRATKPLIRRIYADFYEQMIQQLDREVPGAIVEIGSGSGELKERIPDAVCSDLFPNPWLDLVCDAYRLPFPDGSISNLVLLDVFHHLSRPMAFLSEAARVLAKGGRIVLFEPYISKLSRMVYGVFHHEPIAWDDPIDLSFDPPAEQTYYAAQGNATRLFDNQLFKPGEKLKLLKAVPQSNFAYLLSGGLSKPALYPEGLYPALKKMDGWLSSIPTILGARCLVVLQRQ